MALSYKQSTGRSLYACIFISGWKESFLKPSHSFVYLANNSRYLVKCNLAERLDFFDVKSLGNDTF